MQSKLTKEETKLKKFWINVTDTIWDYIKILNIANKWIKAIFKCYIMSTLKLINPKTPRWANILDIGNIWDQNGLISR